MANAPQLFLDPPTISLEANGKQTQFVTVIFKDSGGRQLVDGNASIFVITDTTVATVDPSGTVKAVAAGSTTLTVTFGAFTATAPVVVTQY